VFDIFGSDSQDLKKRMEMVRYDCMKTKVSGTSLLYAYFVGSLDSVVIEKSTDSEL